MLVMPGPAMTALRKSGEVAPVRVLHAPPAPRTIAETGLDPGFLVDLMAKTIYRMGLERPSEISSAMKLPVGIVAKLIEAAQATKLMETLGQLGASMTAEMRYALTGKGREWALEALAQSEWNGPAPVPVKAAGGQFRRLGPAVWPAGKRQILDCRGDLRGFQGSGIFSACGRGRQAGDHDLRSDRPPSRRRR
jgi:hypothetical protein